MAEMQATAVAHPNIAFIKYWGNRDQELRLPANGSISMTLADLSSKTTVQFDPSLAHDSFTLNDKPSTEAARQRVTTQLDFIRQMAGIELPASVVSHNNFPAAAGIASSASGFAALTLAASKAAGLDLDGKTLSRLARRASGSASRSIFGGFVELLPATTDEGSFAQPIAAADHWPLVDLIAVVEDSEKEVGSTQGHQLANTSPLQPARVQSAPQRLELTREAIGQRDFSRLAQIAELDSDMMHAVMMTSTPSLHYWLPTTIQVMRKIRQLRRQGVPVFYTLDAGPNPHCICPEDRAEIVETTIDEIQGVKRIFRSEVGGPARLVENSSPD